MKSNKLVVARIVWLDWMKVLAILSIIWGHFFSSGYLYLYVFSVQVFCVISGFLYKKSPNWKTCLLKCFWQLFVPTVIMSLIMQMEDLVRCWYMGKEVYFPLIWYIKWLFLGNRWCMGPCWYFYSLMIVRIIMQIFPQKRWLYVFLFLLFSFAVVSYSFLEIKVSNAIVNVLVFMPFFLIGVLLKPLKQTLDHLSFSIEMILLCASIALIFFCGNVNGYVWMYLCEYGNYYVLYIIGGLAGFTMLYVVSSWLSRLPYRQMIQTFSNGSIVIIGLHIIIVRRLMELPNRIWVEDLALAILILFAFLPIIRLSELFFPILLGRRKLKD